jgi:hypothetical protein
MDAPLPELLDALEKAPTLAAMLLTAWHLARALAVKLVEEELKKRAQHPTEWSECPKCGKHLESKGFVGHSLRGLIGLVQWERRDGKADEVLADIQAALALEGLPASARKTLTNLYTYLDAHRDHIDKIKRC